MEEKSEQRTFPASQAAMTGFILAMLAGFAEVLAGLGSRWEFWHFRTGFIILRWAAYAGIVAVFISFIGCILTRSGNKHRGLIRSIIGLLIGLLVIGIPWSYWRTAQSVPPIHDITTDTENPPLFASILPLRTNAPNPSEYGGPEIAAKQRAAYPDIDPLILSIPPNQAFELALSVARSMGWQIVNANELEDRIEAMDTTFWFGFKDDIVVRIVSSSHGSRIDVRSVSRVGKSDVGTNARRIRKYLKKLQKDG